MQYIKERDILLSIINTVLKRCLKKGMEVEKWRKQRSLSRRVKGKKTMLCVYLYSHGPTGRRPFAVFSSKNKINASSLCNSTCYRCVIYLGFIVYFSVLHLSSDGLFYTLCNCMCMQFNCAILKLFVFCVKSVI